MISRLASSSSRQANSRNQKQSAMDSSKQQVVANDTLAADMSSGPYSLSPVQPGDHYSESSSSLSNTDSADSLHGSGGIVVSQISNKAHATRIKTHGSNNNLQAINTKSPILIKYNYYDYNGARQEQTNHDMNFNNQPPNTNGLNKVQRQLSPTFKQNLDQIVRNSQQQFQQQKQLLSSPSNSGGSKSTSPPSSPEHHQQVVIPSFARRYKLSSYEQRCLRCNKTVYQMDKVGPLKDFTFYHQNCFKCRACGTKLTLKTYFNNQQTLGDQEVYCYRHCPKTGPGRLDNQSVGIRAALNAPKVFDVPLPTNHQQNQQLLDYGPGNNHALSTGGQLSPINGAPNVDSRALYIQHAVQQTRLQAAYNSNSNNSKQANGSGNAGDERKISQLISRRLEFLEPKQKLLEMRHREEEDALFKAFEAKWRQEESCISEQIREEWQVELAKLLAKYKRQLSNISTNQSQQAPKLGRPEALASNNNEEFVSSRQKQQEETSKKNMMLIRQLSETSSEPSKQQMIEFERMNLEKTMTIKLDRKKETLKRKLKEFERRATAELVEKQSREMLALISMKLDEFKEEQKRKIGSDLDQFEAIEALANQIGPVMQVSGATKIGTQQLMAQYVAAQPASTKTTATALGFEVPAPKPPQVSKMELYNSEEPDEVFRDIDQLAINVAREDQQSFTDLVHHLTRNCITDIEKARAIFRWITVKNLNTMQFDPSVRPDTPLGLLRGIKNGSESYHVLFKRLCSYAGLHCVVIKGYSKSAGYQPGVRFEGNRFKNSWNAVYVAGAWRFVQCNWGARHLVSVAVMQDKSQANVGSRQVNGNPQPTHAAHPTVSTGGRLHHHRHHAVSPNHGRRGLAVSATPPSNGQFESANHHQQHKSSSSPANYSTSSSSGHSSPSSPQNSKGNQQQQRRAQQQVVSAKSGASAKNSNDSLRYEYDDHYFLTDPDEFIYEFFPLSPEWQLIKTRPITLGEFEQLPFVRSLFFKYGLYFPQQDIRSVLHTDSSGATTIKIGMPTHMIPSLIFHYNLKYYDTDLEHYEGVSLKRFVMQSVESGTASDGQALLANIVSFRVHLPENGAYILDIFANSTTPNQYITGEPMKFKSVCKFKIIAKNLKTVMIPLPDCASGEYGPIKATRLFGIIPLTHESGLISVQNDKRFLEIQFRTTRPLLDFMASLHKNGYDERHLSKSIKIFIEGDIVIVTVKFFEDGQYGLDIYTRDQSATLSTLAPPNGQLNHESSQAPSVSQSENKNHLLTHCCKYLINVRTPNNYNNK